MSNAIQLSVVSGQLAVRTAAPVDRDSLHSDWINKDDNFWAVTFDDKEGSSAFDDLPFSGVECTGYACRLRERLGNRVKIYGFYHTENAASQIAQSAGGHDFAVVDNRWIVDPWLAEIANGNLATHDENLFNSLPHANGVFDLNDPAEKEAITRLYGDRSKWKHLPAVEALADELADGTVPREKKRVAGRITLQKLRRLFDGAAQGRLDEELLDEVYSQWHAHLKTYEAERVNWLKDYTTQEDIAYFNKIYDKIAVAYQTLDNRYTSSPRDKMLALNKAIQIWHDQEPLLVHYRQLHNKCVNNDEDIAFLDWLQNRRSFDEKAPPKKRAAQLHAQPPPKPPAIVQQAPAPATNQIYLSKTQNWNRPAPSIDEIVEAIGKAENSKRYPYGIKPFKEKGKLIDPKGDVAMSRRICFNTVRNNYQRWKTAGMPGEFIEFLGARFCPTQGATDDPTGLNKNWVTNVNRFLQQ